jgi:hypothetical protein
LCEYCWNQLRTALRNDELAEFLDECRSNKGQQELQLVRRKPSQKHPWHTR